MSKKYLSRGDTIVLIEDAKLDNNRYSGLVPKGTKGFIVSQWSYYGYRMFFGLKAEQKVLDCWLVDDSSIVESRKILTEKTIYELNLSDIEMSDYGVDK